jgi:hypothetical protein
VKAIATGEQQPLNPPDELGLAEIQMVRVNNSSFAASHQSQDTGKKQCFGAVHMNQAKVFVKLEDLPKTPQKPGPTAVDCKLKGPVKNFRICIIGTVSAKMTGVPERLEMLRKGSHHPPTSA